MKGDLLAYNLLELLPLPQGHGVVAAHFWDRCG